MKVLRLFIILLSCILFASTFGLADTAPHLNKDIEALKRDIAAVKNKTELQNQARSEDIEAIKRALQLAAENKAELQNQSRSEDIEAVKKDAQFLAEKEAELRAQFRAIEDRMREYEANQKNFTWSNTSDLNPKHVQHHTCGYGGTSCRACDISFSPEPCGCQLFTYSCCCGKIFSRGVIYCDEHP